jgi:drug/metabolite transporter (DMT)-like permease
MFYRPSVLMVATTASFVIADTQIKLIGTSLPPSQIIGALGVVSTLFLGVLCAQQKILSSLPLMLERHVLARSAFDVAGSFLFVAALMHTPLGNMSAIMQSVPLVVAVLAILFLGEKANAARFAAVIVGFIGVLLIVKPTPQSYSVYQLMAIGAVLVVALRDLVTKRIPDHVPLPIITMSNSVAVTIIGWGFALLDGVQPMQVTNLQLLACAGLFVTIGYILIVATVRLGELSATAPFRYSEVVFALLSGFLIFQEYPDALAYLGMALVIGAGFTAARHDARAAREVEADMMPPVF